MTVPVNETQTLPVAIQVEDQVNQLASRTPSEFIKRREGRGGMMLDYVEANYIVARLNSAFRFNWDFTIVEQIISTKARSIATRGRLTVRFADGQEVTKEQWGSSEIKTYKGKNIAVDIPDDMKASASDALKKCASLLGIAWDVYGGFSKVGTPDEEPVYQGEVEYERDVSEEEDEEAEAVPEKEVEDLSGFPDMPDPLEDAQPPDPKVKEEHYKTINITWIDGRRYFISKFDALDLFGKMKKALGQKYYYEILGQNGFEHANQIPKDKITEIMQLMVDAYLGK